MNVYVNILQVLTPLYLIMLLGYAAGTHSGGSSC